MEQLKPPIEMVNYALAYARRGMPVFLLSGKIPYKDTHGLKDATTDEVLIRARWRFRPAANIGLATGLVSGLIVLDVDPRHDGNASLEKLQERYGKLPSTLLSRTPRGGIHRFYKHPQDGEYASPIQLDGLSGLDVRADGAYVVLPPSTLFGGKAVYKWVKEDFPIAQSPDWLLKLLKRPETIIAHQVIQGISSGEKWLENALQRATEGNRNAVGFHLACQLRDDGISESEARSILLAYAQQVQQGKTPYREAEALASLRSAYGRKPRDPARRKS